MKISCIAAGLLLTTNAAIAGFTATVKCDAKGWPAQSYVAVASTYLGAIKAAISKAEKDWNDPVNGDDGGSCYSVDVTPKPKPMSGCSTRSCR